MARAEAPGTLNGRPSPKYVIQTLQRQTQENGQVISGNDPLRQLVILIQNRRLRESLPEIEQFEVIEPLVPPTQEDLAGK